MNISGLLQDWSPPIHRIGHHTFKGFSPHIHRICHNTLIGFVTTQSQDCHNTSTGFITTHSRYLSQYIHRIGHNTFREFVTTHSLGLSPHIYRIFSCNQSLIIPSLKKKHVSLRYLALISIDFHSIWHHTLTGSHGIVTDLV